VRSIGAIPDAITRTVYARECSRLMDIGEEVLITEVAKLRREKLYDGRKQQTPKEGEEATEASSTTTPLHDVGDVNRYFEKAEEEILYYLLKYGTHRLFSIQQDGESRDILVAEYIFAELLNDELEFKNECYRKLFEEYHRLTDEDNESRIKHFINHPDREISDKAIQILSDLPTLTVQRFTDSLEPEDLRLPLIIPKAILVYKSRRTKIACDETVERLKQAQDSGDAEQLKTLLERLTTLQEINKRLALDLKRLTF